MNRTVITRLVPLTTSVAIHAALVALVISLVDLRAPIERVFLLELTELETPAPVASPASVPSPPRPPEAIPKPKASTKPKPVAPVEPASPVVPPAPPVEAAPPAPRSLALEPPSSEPRAVEAPAPESHAVPSMAPEPSKSSHAPEPAAPAPTSPSRSMGASVVGPFDVAADAAPRSRPSSRAQSDTTSAPGAAVAALPPGSVTRRAIPRGGYQVRPAYPTSARRLGIEGTTLLGVLVADDGRVTEIVVKQSAGHPDLDRAAAEAVRQWRFEPARQGSDAVSMWVLLPVEFRLR